MNSYLIWYLDINNRLSCMIMYGPSYQKAWSDAVCATYMVNKEELAATLLRVEIADQRRTAVYESPYKNYMMENNEYVKHFYEQLAVQTHSSFSECVEHGP